MRTLASVDFPEPFGPIIAWTSPCRTVRSIPLRISLPSTLARRPRISIVAVGTAVSVIAHLVVVVHEDVAVLDLHGEHADGLRRRQRGRPPRLEVERRPVLRALDRPEVGVDLTLVEEVVRVRTDRVHGAEPV